MAQKKAQQYDNQSIKALKGADRVRKRPAVIFGSDGLEGCEHSFFEILSNSVDEAREGHGNEIRVTVYRDLSIQVDDYGRGVPLGWNEAEQRWNWDLIYCELYAGGKYDNNSGDSAYEYSLGLNGLGACATQCSSEFMTVRSYDGTTERSISFRQGEVQGELCERPLTKKDGKRTGTSVHWKPDLEVFTDINIPHEFYAETLRRQSVANAGVNFILLLEQEDGSFSEQNFHYVNGISDYLAERVGSTAFTAPVFWHLEARGRDREDKEDYKLKGDITFCFTNDAPFIEFYHNSSFLEHDGSHDTATKTAFVFALNKYIEAAGLYKKGETTILFSDVADSLALVINSFSTLSSYENQTKKAVKNGFIQKELTAFMKENLKNYFVEHPKEAEKIAKQALTNKRSREAADRIRKGGKMPNITNPIDVANRVEKFVNCRTKDVTRAELYIVEGDSALTSCKLGRDAEFQAIIPVRGKTLNCLKSDFDKIFKNEIILDLLRVFGCGVEVKGKVKSDSKKQDAMNDFKLENLRWSKIIICTDADEDGFQIRTLLLTIFYRLLPTLLKEHKVFIAESPLFEITTKDETFFAYDEFEKAEILKKLGNKKYTLQRSKGLGENEPEMMWQTTMNPETRRLISVSPADVAQTEFMFDTLLGDNLPARKVFITENGHRYMKDIDV
ncbi:MAG: DNA topoisomerase [Ruminococcaceae bacterium]|nr:DNA topoisomerase [Oscillospiraceae bacterium]